MAKDFSVIPTVTCNWWLDVTEQMAYYYKGFIRGVVQSSSLLSHSHCGSQHLCVSAVEGASDAESHGEELSVNSDTQ